MTISHSGYFFGPPCTYCLEDIQSNIFPSLSLHVSVCLVFGAGSRAVLAYYQSGPVREYTVQEGDKLHMECNAPRSVPNATFSWSIARSLDTEPQLLRLTRRMQINSNGSHHSLHPVVLAVP